MPLERIVVPDTRDAFEQAAADIAAHRFVGFDTESKPTFAKGETSTGPHIVQFATPERAYLFQMHRAEGRDALARLLGSTYTVKVGFSLGSDRGHIQRKLGVPLRAVLDLTTVFRQRGYRNEVGVRAAVAMVLNQRFSKSKKMSTSNWSLATLSPGQKLYAANDAFGAMAVFTAMNIAEHDLPITDDDE